MGCTNTDGTHTCACADGYTGDGYSTERYTAANAVEGFVAPGGVDPATYTGCADVDECILYTDTCGAEPEPTEGPTIEPSIDPSVPTNNCAGLGSICDHASCDDEVETNCGRTT